MLKRFTLFILISLVLMSGCVIPSDSGGPSSGSEDSFVLSFDKKAEDATGEMSNMDINVDQTVSLTLCAFSRPGYCFQGWSTSSDGDVEYDDGDRISILDADVVLYACWIEVFEVSDYETGVTIDSYNGNDTVLNIPSTINGKTVLAISESAFETNDEITEITFPETIKSIGNNAFYYCENLASVPFSDSIEEIGDLAFYLCISLVSAK